MREGLYLALCSLPDAAREDLLAELGAAFAAANPLVGDVGGGTVEDVLAPRRGWLLPLLNAALTLGDGAFATADGHVVALSRKRSDADVSAWGDARGDAKTERSRAAAWPLSFALRLRFESSSATTRAWDALRRSVLLPEGSLGLVVDRSSAARRRRIGLGDLPAQARRATGASRAAASPFEKMMLDALASSTPPDVPLPWLALGDDELLVCPRQGALARPNDVLREVQRALGADASVARVRGRGAATETPLGALAGVASSG